MYTNIFQLFKLPHLTISLSKLKLQLFNTFLQDAVRKIEQLKVGFRYFFVHRKFF